MEEKKKKKRRQPPDALYTQELLHKSELLNIRLEKRYIDEEELRCFNMETTLAAEFCTKIYNIYSSYGARLALRSEPSMENKRWKHMTQCLVKAGKAEAGAQLSGAAEFERALSLKHGMISYAQLLYDEERVSLDAMCHVLIGLGWLSADAPGEAQEDASRDEKTTRRKEAVREPKKRFMTYMPQEGETKEERSRIRYAARPFGYWLLKAGDDERRAQIIRCIRQDADALVSGMRGGKKDAANEDEFAKYACLTRQKSSTLRTGQGAWTHDANKLETGQGAWSHNANKLHMIIAGCRRGDGAQRIVAAYHAFGLHPVGLEEKKDGVPMHRWPDFPADQVVLAAIETFRPLIACVKTRDYSGRMSVFWGLLYAQLQDYDEGVFAGTKLGLKDKLFYKTKLEDEDLGFYQKYYAEDGEMFVPEKERLKRIKEERA